MDDTLNCLGQTLLTALPADVSRFYVEYDEVNLVIHAPSVRKVLTFLRDDPSCLFVCPIDVTGVDYPSREKRFDVVYHLLSPHHNVRIRVKAALGEGEAIDSAVALYPGLLWFEREAYDMFGIHFAGHPDLRRLLTDYGFTGHPLRKDFPKIIAISIFSRLGKASHRCNCPAMKRQGADRTRHDTAKPAQFHH